MKCITFENESIYEFGKTPAVALTHENKFCSSLCAKLAAIFQQQAFAVLVLVLRFTWLWTLMLWSA